jgi:glycosyltransferase involved in cell wall biosynthesis
VYSRRGIDFLGGGERYAYNLAKALRRFGEVSLVTFGPLPYRAEVDGLEHLVIPALGRNAINPLPLTPLLFGRRYDIIHAHQLGTIVTSLLAVQCRRNGTPLVVTDEGGRGRSPMYRMRLYAYVSRFLLISEHSRSLLPAEAREKATIVRGGVDLDRFRYNGSARGRQVVQVGRIMPHKGINYLLDAAEDDFTVVIAGRIVYRDYFESLQERSKGKRIRFLLDPPDRDIDQAYRQSAVTVAASVYRDVYGVERPHAELLGLTLLESMAVGTPVICTAVGGMPEYVRDGETGFVVAPNDSIQLRRAIRAILDDPALGRRLGRQGREFVEDYSWDSVADRVYSEYRAILQERNPRLRHPKLGKEASRVH